MLIRYQLTNTGIYLEHEDGTRTDITTIDAILLLSYLKRDQLALEKRIIPGGDDRPSSPTEFQELRDRTQRLISHIQQMQRERPKTTLVRPPLVVDCPHCGCSHDGRLVPGCAENPLRNMTIQLPVPLPCVSCGKQAFDALSVADARESGAWIMRPLCRRCAHLPAMWVHFLETETDITVAQED